MIRFTGEQAHCFQVALEESWQSETLNAFFDINYLSYWAQRLEEIGDTIQNFTTGTKDRDFFWALSVVELQRLNKPNIKATLPCGHAIKEHVAWLKAWQEHANQTALGHEWFEKLPPTFAKLQTEVAIAMNLAAFVKVQIPRSVANKLIQNEVDRLAFSLKWGDVKDIMWFEENPNKRNGLTLKEITARLERGHDATLQDARKQLEESTQRRFEIVEGI